MDREYVVDGNIIGWVELIMMAENIDPGFSERQIKQTSEAAAILREYGYSVSPHKEDK